MNLVNLNDGWALDCRVTNLPSFSADGNKRNNETVTGTVTILSSSFKLLVRELSQSKRWGKRREFKFSIYKKNDH